jgi:hypothetical protein
MYSYQAFKLKILSELYFPELVAYSTEEIGPHDVHIYFGKVNPEGLANSKSHYLYVQGTDNALWLHIPSIARFLITDGCQIIIDPSGNVDQESIRVFLLGSCMGALLMQRNLFLLHGNAIRVGDHCISFAGQSGAGKSTLSGAFLNRGYEILADDICAINEHCEVLPSFPQIKLWFDSAKQLNINTEVLRKIRPNIEKFAIPLGKQFHKEPLPLKVIFILKAHNKDEILFEPINGMHKLNPLKANTYRRQYLNKLGKEHSFKLSGKIASQTAIVKITRPNFVFKLDELVSLIKENLQEQEFSHA